MEIHLQGDNQTDDVDKRQPNDVQQCFTKATDDAINNNRSSNFHSTALIKDVIHKKPAAQRDVQEKTEVDVDVLTMSVVAKPSAKPMRPSFESRERDYTYDDAIEDYKTRVSKSAMLDLPKVNINKRRELFEKESQDDCNTSSVSSAASKLGSEIVSIKDRISSLRSTSTVNAAPAKKVELPTTTKLKDRLSSLHQVSSPVDELKRNPIETQFKNVQEAKHEFELKQQQQTEHQNHNGNAHVKLSVNDDNESLESTDREDSGIQTTDVSSSVSQADEQQADQQLDEFPQVMQENFSTSSVGEAAKAPVTVEALKDDDVEMDDDESSVSCSEKDQTQSVLVLTIDDTINKTKDHDSKPSSNDAAAILDFIQCNLLDDHRPFDDIQIDNNYAYECIINRSEYQKTNGLEKSNSIDTTLSLCSSSDGQGLMDDAGEKINRE